MMACGSLVVLASSSWSHCEEVMGNSPTSLCKEVFHGRYSTKVFPSNLFEEEAMMALKALSLLMIASSFCWPFAGFDVELSSESLRWSMESLRWGLR